MDTRASRAVEDNLTFITCDAQREREESRSGENKENKRMARMGVGRKRRRDCNRATAYVCISGWARESKGGNLDLLCKL